MIGLSICVLLHDSPVFTFCQGGVADLVRQVEVGVCSCKVLVEKLQQMQVSTKSTLPHLGYLKSKFIVLYCGHLSSPVQ